jgi:hypothetical protein
MTAVLSLLAGLAVGVAVCALLVALIARVWRGPWRRALVYFGLGDDPELLAEERERPPTELPPATGERGSFDWPSEHAPPVRRA